MTVDPVLVDNLTIEMSFSYRQDYGGRFSVQGIHKHSLTRANTFGAEEWDGDTKKLSFGRRIVNELKSQKREYPDNIPSLTISMAADLFKRLNFQKYILSYCLKNGITIEKWDIAANGNHPPITDVTLANVNPREFIAILAVAMKDNASMLGTRYAAFDSPALEAVPEIKSFMQKHMSRSV